MPHCIPNCWVSINFIVTPADSNSAKFLGDLLVGFQTPAPTSGRGSTSWQREMTDNTWQLWRQPPGPGWKGFPVAHFTPPGWQIWLLGEVYGHSAGTPKLETFLAEIAEGCRPAAELNGHLLLLAWNERRREWHVWTDRFGTIHAYHAWRDGVGALGTCLTPVAQLASRRQLDWPALTGFFGFGFFPQDRTYFDDVRVLRPATHYIFAADGQLQQTRRYVEWKHQPDPQRSYEDTVAAFGELFEAIMQEQLHAGRVAVPISGGLDSRSTVAAIRSEMAPRFWSYSYGYGADSVETRISRQVAAARQLPFQALAMQPYLFDRLDLVLASVEGFQDVTQSRQALVADELAARADYVIAAHWGDVWLDDMGLMDDPAGTVSPEQVAAHTLKKMAKRGRAWLLANVCAPQLPQQSPDDVLQDYIADGLKPLTQLEDPDFRVKAFKTDNWSFRWTLSSLRMFQPGAFPRLPFYDIRIADFFSTVPSAFVQGRRLQVDFLKRFAPDLARVKWQTQDANLYDYQKFDPLRLPRRAVRKAWRLATGRKIIERNWEVQFGGAAGRAGLEHWLVRPGLRLHEFVSPEKLQGLLTDFQRDPLGEGRGYTVSMLLTFSAWLERHAR